MFKAMGKGAGDAVGAMLLVLLSLAVAVAGLTEVEECKEWVSRLNTTTPAQSGDKTEVIQSFSNCEEFKEIQLQKDPEAQQISTISVDGTAYTRKSGILPLEFLGFAFEYKGIMELSPGGEPNTAVVRMFENLAKYGHELTILVGGNSAMHVRLGSSILPRLPGADIVMNDTTLTWLENIAWATRSKLTLGIPMLSRDLRYAVEFTVDGILKNIDTSLLRAIELGNEPDHWLMLKKCYRKDPDFGFSVFMAEYRQLEAALSAAWPADLARVPFQGPAIAGCNTFPPGQLPCWQSDLPAFAAQASSSTKFISYHRYGNSGCSKYSNLRTLMNDPIPGDATKSYDWLDSVMQGIGSGGPTVLWSEGNAFSCGGNLCLSKVFAVTLWALDNMFEVALRGVGGAYMHAVPGHIYTPFNPIGSHRVEVMPVYYSTLAFSELIDTPSSSVFKPVMSVDSSLIKVWGIDNGARRRHYCVIHKDVDQRSPLVVKLGSGGSVTATLSYLTAPDPFSEEISFRGQYINENGVLAGSKEEITLFAVNGEFSFQVEPMSVAMVAISA